jgi:arylsulfatase
MSVCLVRKDSRPESSTGSLRRPQVTNFHVAQPVCSASRAALLTGCYPNRIGIHGALGPAATHGIADGEMTLAELVKQKGYATGMAGKWHLGRPCAIPADAPRLRRILRLPYSNDMWPLHPEAKAGHLSAAAADRRRPRSSRRN